ncbi:hypothetical protein SLA2020_169710 [Shorea laevis]
MMSSKKLTKIATKWKKLAARRRKRIVLSPVPAEKGHFIAYTADRKHFMIPLEYLGDRIFSELLKMSEEQFGFPADGPISLPCESQVMEYIILLTTCGASKDLEKILLASVASSNCSISSLSHEEWKTQQLLVCTC